MGYPLTGFLVILFWLFLVLDFLVCLGRMIGEVMDEERVTDLEEALAELELILSMMHEEMLDNLIRRRDNG